MSGAEGLESVAASAANAHDAPDMRGGDAPDAGDAFDVAELGDGCPVTPLGFLGQKFYFLDFAGQLIQLGSEFRKGELMALFGTRMAWLAHQWPQWKKTGEEKTGEVDGQGKPVMRAIYEEDGFSQKLAQEGLIMACSKADMFDPKNKVRGRGAHRGRDGELVLHCGKSLLVGGRKGTRNNPVKPGWFKAGLFAGFVYPTAPPLPLPDDRPAEVNIAMEVLTKLETWTWKRPEIDAYLLLCWLAAAMIGGFLRIRPHGWITGPSGAGKTTLQKFLQLIMDEWGIFTEDATEAGVRQLLDQDTLAVMFDEIEAEEDNQAVVAKIVRLARLAYSGASSVRGSSDHQAKQFVARSCFLFSSIHHHELPAQDRNRIAILHLSKFPAKTPPLDFQDATVRQWGAALRRRLIEQIGRFDRTLERYQAEMLRHGYTGREQDTYGTLLACGDLLLHNDAPAAAMSGEQDRVAEKVRALAGLLDVAREESVDTTERCLGWLGTFKLPAKSGCDQESVSTWVRKAVVAMASVNGATSHRMIAAGPREKLAGHGLRLIHLRADHAKRNGQGGMVEAFDPTAKMWLAVANKTHAGTAQIFEKSAWPHGMWRQPLSLIDGALTTKKDRFGDAMKAHGCVLIPIAEVIDVAAAIEEAADDARQGELREAAAAEKRYGAGDAEPRG